MTRETWQSMRPRMSGGRRVWGGARSAAEAEGKRRSARRTSRTRRSQAGGDERRSSDTVCARMDESGPRASGNSEDTEASFVDSRYEWSDVSDAPDDVSGGASGGVVGVVSMGSVSPVCLISDFASSGVVGGEAISAGIGRRVEW